MNAIYTINGLAAECGMSLRNTQRHIRAGTCQLHKAIERIPGVGIRIDGRKAQRFIAAMRAKHSNKLSTHHAV